MASGIKTSFGATGQSAEFVVTARSTVLYFADFATGSGVGTVQLQVRTTSGDWIAADEAVTTDMTNAKVVDSASTNTRHYRWNCSAYTSGTIACYLE